MDRHNYLEILSEQIRCKKALPLVTREIEMHIEDQKQDFMASGMTEQEAEAAAVMEMGDPVEVGVDMDRIHRPKMNWRLAIGILFVHIMGLALIQYMNMNVKADILFLYNPMKYILFTGVGFLLMLAVCYIDYTRIAYRAKEIIIIGMIVCVLLYCFYGGTINGRSYFIIGNFGVTLNPSIMMMLFLPLYSAVVYNYRGEGYKGLWKAVLWATPCIAILFLVNIVGFFIFIPVLALILSFAVYKGFFKVSVKMVLTGIWSVIILLPLVCVAWIMRFDYGYYQMRLKAMLNPESYAMEEGYQYYMVRKLLSHSKFIGRGIDSSSAIDVIPDSNNFVLTYIAAYFGIYAAVIVLCVMFVLLAKLIRVTLRQKNQLGALMGIGCGSIMVAHIVLYALMNMGIIISGSLYCPFITPGGTGIFVIYILLGLMLSIYRYQNVSEAEKPGRIFARKECC